MEKNDQQLDKEKHDRQRRSRLTGKIEEHKNYIISEIDELSANISYNVIYPNIDSRKKTLAIRTTNNRWGEITQTSRTN